MDPLSDSAELALSLIYQEHVCDLLNADAPRLVIVEMLREAYQQGAKDAGPKADFDEDVRTLVGLTAEDRAAINAKRGSHLGSVDSE